jgi:excisionase family DNA binding protein
MRGADKPEAERAPEKTQTKKIARKLSVKVTDTNLPRPDDQMLNTLQVADRLDVSKNRVSQFVVTGRLRAYKLGRLSVFDPTDVQEFAKLPRSPGSRSSSPRGPKKPR